MSKTSVYDLATLSGNVRLDPCMKGQDSKHGSKSIFGPSPQTTLVYKMSMNISHGICDVVLFQETIIARHPNKQIQTPDDLKRKKKPKPHVLSLCSSTYIVRLSM